MTALERTLAFLEARRDYLIRDGSPDAANELTCALRDLKRAIRADAERAPADSEAVETLRDFAFNSPQGRAPEWFQRRAQDTLARDGCRTCHRSWSECEC